MTLVATLLLSLASAVAMGNARSYASVSCESEDICTAQMDEQARLAAVDSLTVHLARAVTRFGLKLADGSGDDTLNVSYAILEQVKRPTSEEAPDEEHAHIFIPLSRVNCGIACTVACACTCMSADLRNVQFNIQKEGILMLQVQTAKKSPRCKLTISAGNWSMVTTDQQTTGWSDIRVPSQVISDWQNRVVQLTVSCAAPHTPWKNCISANENGYLQLALLRKGERRVPRSADNAMCSLRFLEIDLAPILNSTVWPNPLIYPYCAGICTPLAVGNRGVLWPCCTAKSYTTIDVTIVTGHHFDTIELDKAAAADCHCT